MRPKGLHLVGLLFLAVTIINAPAWASADSLGALTATPAPTSAREPSRTPAPTATLRPTLPYDRDENSPYDGYWWFNQESWVPGYISLETWYTPAPRRIIGGAVFYAPGVMAATAKVRGFSLKGYVDGVSLMSPADIGRSVWLKRPGYDWEGPFLVVDCARRGDMYPIIVGREEAVEVGWDTASRWGMGYGDGTSWHTRKAKILDVQVWTESVYPYPDDLARYPLQRYDEWFLPRVRFSTIEEDRGKGRIYTWTGHPGCWVWWQNEDVYCPGDFYGAPWVNPADYRPGWPTKTPTPTLTPGPTSSPMATPTPTVSPFCLWKGPGCMP